MEEANQNDLLSLPFDLLETGTCGHLELVPLRDKTKETPAEILPKLTLPCGLPPVLDTLEEEVQKYLNRVEDLPVHNDIPQHSLISRTPDYSRLLHMDLCPAQTAIKVERDSTTGQLIGFTEELVPDAAETSRNSLSLRRAPDINSIRVKEDVRGSNINLPFWPGGMDPDEDILRIKSEKPDDSSRPALDLNLDDVSKYLSVPPGFECGMTFDETEAEGSEGMSQTDRPTDSTTMATNTVINLADIMAGVDDLDLGESDDDEESKEEMKSSLENKDEKQMQSSGVGLSKSESLEKLTQVEDKEDSQSAAVKTKAQAPAEEWAVKVDTSSPVQDFYKKVPDMAYKWPFELDIFQKQAILRLEAHESVFVAAHTSAGKTVVAEYAIALSLKHMTRAIYTSPIKALSNQKFREFKLTFGDVGLVTGDVQLNQTAACLIMTTEILRSMLYNGSDIVRDLEWVIFDEVHYINDSERGVVWEEVLIMLPQHVNVILLSATVPNTMEFAAWVGRTKRKKIYVVSTLKRPVPLEHYLYTGNSTKTCNELFLLQDAKGNFLTSGYSKALEAKKERASKSSQSFGAKGTRPGNPIQDKNTWLSVIEMLKRKDKLPAVAFTFSKKKIEENAGNLQSVDLTTSSEKSEIHVFFHKCIDRLKGSDRSLPQVLQLADMLKRGLGVHHSGVLPILKEVVEMLFQKGLVKILFATETFAMGVNMPARTVIFDSIRKHDGMNFRNLLPGEYIQMAGRAGRRGLDTTGTVILLCKGDVPEMSELHRMMLGKPTSLESRFRLTYTMILNLLRVEQLRVQDMIKRSFSEFHHQQESVSHRQQLNVVRDKMRETKPIECYLCSLDLERYYEDCREFHRLREHLQSVIFTHPAAIKALSAGRVIMVKRPHGQSVLGVVLTTSQRSGGSTPSGERKFTVLVIAEKPGVNSDGSSGDRDSAQDKTAGVSKPNIEPVLPSSLFVPAGPCWHELRELTSSDIVRITTKTIKVDADGIISDTKRRELPRFQNNPPDRCVTMATQELLQLTESADPTGLPGLHPVNDLKLRDIDLVEQCRALQFLEEGFSSFNCIRCPEFMQHFTEHDQNMSLKDEFNRLQFLLSDESLVLLPEYTQRVEVLKRLHYMDSSGTVQLKGRVACEMSNHELVVTELVFENALTDLDPAQIAALLSCFVFEMKRCSEPNLTEALIKGRDQILAKAQLVGQLQREVGMTMPVEDYMEQFHFGLMEVVYEWAQGKVSAGAMERKKV
ncbi:helicase ski2w [Plakobranchus ocellatus]|uniref:Helicase ski2w n=1 Tax=Plakobranchus ocellatus TaxID=259542 RepID=A0AAV4AHS3_9GAST|nr:helicase ski2w [Plakobranchus ocellatus]